MDRLRELPSINELLERPAVRALAERIGRAAALQAARDAVAEARALIQRGQPAEVTEASVEAFAQRLLQPKLRRVINATGVVLHTNLGRAPLHPEAAARAAEVAAGYSNLELDLATGRRGARHAAIESLAVELFGSEAAHVVGNCAGATLLSLAALGAGGSAVVSRGELVEIGGGFRVPEILNQSGCRLHEVGTTNRTHLRDYEAALDALAGQRVILLRVHRSNFALVGFSTEPSVAELSKLARARGVPLLHDLGSGAVSSIEGEPTARDSLSDGADLVMVSGDKLFGGPQAGLLLGKRALIERCRKHPLARALRADKMLLAALEATLQLYQSGRQGEIPALRMLNESATALRQRATKLALLLGEKGVQARVAECEGQVGGGSLPQARLPSSGVVMDSSHPPQAVLAALRSAPQPVVALVRDGAVLFDVRCIRDDELAAVAASAGAALAGLAAGQVQPSGDASDEESAKLEAEEDHR